MVHKELEVNCKIANLNEKAVFRKKMLIEVRTCTMKLLNVIGLNKALGCLLLSSNDIFPKNYNYLLCSIILATYPLYS